MNDNGVLDPYLAILRSLPFVRRVKVARHADELTIEAAHARQTLRCELVRSHLSLSNVEAWIGRTKGANPPLLLLAPYVSDAMGTRLRDGGVFYLDTVGNLSISIADGKGRAQHVALVQGNAPSRASPAERAWRAESYQVLFTLLAEPALLAGTVRTIAARAGVSTSPVLQVRERLLQQGWIVSQKTGLHWTPGSTTRARDYWLAGYHATLRPRLLIHRFRPRPGLMGEALLSNFASRLGDDLDWRWGGATAAALLDQYYQSETTVVHIHAPNVSAQELALRMHVIPDTNGPLVLLRRPGLAAFEPKAPKHTVHPLLVWAELLEEANDRATEAAAEFAARHLPDAPG